MSDVSTQYLPVSGSLGFVAASARIALSIWFRVDSYGNELPICGHKWRMECNLVECFVQWSGREMELAGAGGHLALSKRVSTRSR
ncbi:jg8253 [Pararge aegeria aegeria]|uniref:Jg8253 protein n=1 Tax=Pararge aegeria aegeria TaxID=348720 RepID=A0A8S4RQD9_9NEOP|nr:jg8253 [Pararge aegeria aegeria]